MKLPIKKKYFDLIKAGKKTLEFREAHITFYCKKTGEELTKQIKGVSLKHTDHAYILNKNLTLKEWKELFKENWIIVFEV